MSEDTLSMILTMLGPLLGAVIGGMITYFTSRGIEDRKWRQTRREKHLEEKREGLSKALEWIEPMRNAEMTASSLVMGVIRGDVEEDRFLEEYPNLLSQLVELDLSAAQRALLPDSVYMRGLQIQQSLEELRPLGVKYGQEARVMKWPMAGLQECSEKLDDIKQQIDTLELDLREEFHRTFE